MTVRNKVKVLSWVGLVLWLFAAHKAFPISVNPKSKTALRESQKKYSASRSNLDAVPKGKGAAGSGRRNTSHRSGGYGSKNGEKNQIVYTVPEPKEFRPAIISIC